MNIQGWLQDKVKEADALFPGHGSFFMIRELQQTSVQGIACYVASDIPAEMLKDSVEELVEGLGEGKEEFSLGH